MDSMLKIIEELSKRKIMFRVNRKYDCITFANDMRLRFDKRFGTLKSMKHISGSIVFFVKEVFFEDCNDCWILKVYGENDLICDMMFEKVVE